MGNHRRLDIEPDHAGGAVPVGQQDRNPAGAAADVDDRPAPEVHPGQQALDLLRTAGGEESVAPHLFEEENRVQRIVLVACRRHGSFHYRAAASAAAIFCCRSIRYAAIATPMATVRMMMVASALMSGRRPSRILE